MALTKNEYLNKQMLLKQQYDRGEIVKSDYDAWMFDLDWQYNSDRTQRELSQVTSRGTLTIEIH